MQMSVLTPRSWSDYELLDSGDGEKLERYGPYVLRRPEAQALHHKSLPAKRGNAADATFEKAEAGEGRWVERTKLPERWLISYHNLRFWVRL
jgi:23S rRNA (cytosine1962-C5)-methyltransferase